MIEGFISDKNFNLEPLVECYKLRTIGLYALFLFFSGGLFNGLLLWIFYKNKDLRTPLNSFIIALTALNLSGCLFELPFIIISNLYCKWIFGKFGCLASGFIMYFIGCTSIYLMVAISIERYYIIYKPLSMRIITLSTCVKIISFCIFMAVVWAVLPLFGWSRYSLEGALTSCSVEWKERSLGVTSYNITMFLLVFVVPLITIIFTNIRLIFMIRNKSWLIKTANNNVSIKRKSCKERKATFIIICLISVFIISWTPYASVTMYIAFINTDLDPIFGTLPALFAKSSMLWTSIIFMFSNDLIKKKLKTNLELTYDNKSVDFF